ncbi:hypothetical protein PMALA_033180 [Plasmodium malariae]|uniref:Uncharacterized protein n=1 Tax=Plasmodium malariae TaxID=5858 RepID=A0A1A8WJS4_PLAMA|nr:hypothetical protein PMALA_033180 [Plasmodium malariae]
MVVDSELVAEPKWLLEVEIVIKRQEVLDVESNSVDYKDIDIRISPEKIRKILEYWNRRLYFGSGSTN